MAFNRKRCVLASALSCLALLLLLLGCATHPLGMSDEEWNQLTPEQKLEARKQDEQNRLEREKLRQEERQRKEEEQRARDIADGMILEFSPDAPYCIGGDRCPRGSFPEIILSLKQYADVDKILFYADDNIGRKHEGKVTVLADGVPVARNIDIDRHGTWYQVLVARPARNITLRAVGDDEVSVRIVKVYGSWIRNGRRVIVR